MEFLTEIDKLVQLIESPIFTCKYTELLQYSNHIYKNIMHFRFETTTFRKRKK